VRAQELVHSVALFCRFYGCGPPVALATPYGWFTALLDEAPRLAALEKRDLVDVHHTRDPKWLVDRLTTMSRDGVVLVEQDDETVAANWDMLYKLLGR